MAKTQVSQCSGGHDHSLLLTRSSPDRVMICNMLQPSTFSHGEQLFISSRPGLREHFIFGEHKYCSEKFSRLFVANVRFIWPFDARDTYIENHETGLYQFSEMSLRQSSDIQSYTVESDLFNEFPEF